MVIKAAPVVYDTAKYVLYHLQMFALKQLCKYLNIFKAPCDGTISMGPQKGLVCFTIAFEQQSVCVLAGENV